MFCVSVPVLSEQIMETQPKPSTARKFFIIAFSSAILEVPIAREMVTIEDRASGIAATARATANMRESSMGIDLYMLRKNTAIHIDIIITERFLPNLSREV